MLAAFIFLRLQQAAGHSGQKGDMIANRMMIHTCAVIFFTLTAENNAPAGAFSDL